MHYIHTYIPTYILFSRWYLTYVSMEALIVWGLFALHLVVVWGWWACELLWWED